MLDSEKDIQIKIMKELTEKQGFKPYGREF